MKYVIVFLGIVAAGSAASVSSSNKQALSEPNRPYRKTFIESQDAPILISRGVSESVRQATTLNGRLARRPAIKAPSNSVSSSDTEVKIRSQTTSSVKPSGATSQANTSPKRSTPSGSYTRASRSPGSQQLLEEYLRQEHEGRQSPQLFHPESRNRAPQLLNIIKNRIGNLESGGSSSSTQRSDSPEQVGWGGLPSDPQQRLPGQLYSESRTGHLLGVIQKASKRNIQQHLTEKYHKTVEHVGWGGRPLPRTTEADPETPDRPLGAGGFPNLAADNSNAGVFYHKRTSNNPNPRVGRRYISPNQAPTSSFTLTRRAGIKSKDPSPSSFSGLFSPPSSPAVSPPASPERRGQSRRLSARPRRAMIGGPSGRPIYRQSTLAQRLARVGGPSRASAASESRRQQHRMNANHPRPDPGGTEEAARDPVSHGRSPSSTSSPTAGAPNDLLTQQLLSRLGVTTTPHPLLAHLPASIEGSVSPGSSRENSPQRGHAQNRSSRLWRSHGRDDSF